MHAEEQRGEHVTDLDQSTAADIAVTLTPNQARSIAVTIRIELASQWDSAWISSLPCREEVERARSLLDACDDQLEELKWGESADTVELHSDSARLEQI